ncbi:MAG: hypothetical protein CMC15_14850 [Flavobacteriaceae bacterium]|nr:hypothetical protein [Flavobacteriaceae bacterium]
MHRLELDIEIASEVSKQISDATSKSKDRKSNIKGVIARRKQARAAAQKNAITDEEAVNMLFGNN